MAGRVGARALLGGLAAALVGAFTWAPAPTAAQGTVVGVVAGAARTTQDWTPDESTDPITGVIVGAFADAATPLGWLFVRGEAAYVRRGGDVELMTGGQPAQGRIRVDYLSVGVHAGARGSFGPIDAHLFAGPTLDQPLRSRLDPVLAQAIPDEDPVVFAVALGGGLGGWITERLFAAVELRLTEGLSDAHQGSFTSVRNRSVEGVARLGIPLSLLRGR